MTRYPVKVKKVFRKRDLDPRLLEYLERVSGKKLTRLVKIPVGGGSYVLEHGEGPFSRWLLEGITNKNFGNTGNKISLLHSALRLPLQEFFPHTLIHVGTHSQTNSLILDFRGPQDIFQEIDSQAYETYKDLPPSGFKAAEEKLIRIPYIQYFWCE